MLITNDIRNNFNIFLNNISKEFVDLNKDLSFDVLKFKKANEISLKLSEKKAELNNLLKVNINNLLLSSKEIGCILTNLPKNITKNYIDKLIIIIKGEIEDLKEEFKKL